MNNKTKFFGSIERSQRPAIAAFLRQMGDKIDQGLVVLKQADSEVEIPVPEEAQLEVGFTRRDTPAKTVHKIDIEIRWSERAPGAKKVELT